jgi:hypothetical protein
MFESRASVRAPGELAAFWGRMADIDQDIAAAHAEGYDVDVLLDDRAEWQRERNELMGGTR